MDLSNALSEKPWSGTTKKAGSNNALRFYLKLWATPRRLYSALALIFPPTRRLEGEGRRLYSRACAPTRKFEGFSRMRACVGACPDTPEEDPRRSSRPDRIAVCPPRFSTLAEREQLYLCLYPYTSEFRCKKIGVKIVFTQSKTIAINRVMGKIMGKMEKNKNGEQ